VFPYFLLAKINKLYKNYCSSLIERTSLLEIWITHSNMLTTVNALSNAH